MPEGLNDDVIRARNFLRDARSIIALTGAGISAESGVPTFRGPEGLWKNFRPEDLATARAFERDPRLVWEWYGWRRERISACRPNAAHVALARVARSRGAVIVTQNVDELHRDAAASLAGGQPELLELHGSIFRVRCTRCGVRRPHRDPIDASRRETLPACESCGALLRPDVVWFGESLDPAILDAAYRAAAAAEVALVIGTSSVVYPAASIAEITLRSGGTVIEINPADTPLTAVATISIRGTAVDAVPPLLAD